jgi:hypothetical protein
VPGNGARTFFSKSPHDPRQKRPWFYTARAAPQDLRACCVDSSRFAACAAIKTNKPYVTLTAGSRSARLNIFFVVPGNGARTFFSKSPHDPRQKRPFFYAARAAPQGLWACCVDPSRFAACAAIKMNQPCFTLTAGSRSARLSIFTSRRRLRSKREL